VTLRQIGGVGGALASEAHRIYDRMGGSAGDREAVFPAPGAARRGGAGHTATGAGTSAGRAGEDRERVMRCFAAVRGSRERGWSR